MGAVGRPIGTALRDADLINRYAAEDGAESEATPMSAPPTKSAVPIADKTRLVAYLESGARPRADWRIGTEHEKFAYRLDDLRPVPFDGPDGIEALLKGMTRFGWQPVEEKGRVIALTNGQGCRVTLERGGQIGNAACRDRVGQAVN